jgi:hypothetical protein
MACCEEFDVWNKSMIASLKHLFYRVAFITLIPCPESRRPVAAHIVKSVVL